MKRICILGLLISLLPGFLAPSVRAAGRQVLHDHMPAAVVGLRPTGRLPGSTRLDLAIGLPLRHQEALTNLLRQLYDPSSPSYHRFLSPQQFAEQFGPSPEDYE